VEKKLCFLRKTFQDFLHTMDFNGNQIVEVQIYAVSKVFEMLQRALHDPS